MAATQVGILGIGIFMPPQIRGNDWWPEAIVSEWRAKLKANLVRPRQSAEELPSEGAKRAVQSMAAFADDPFKGAQERRVMPEGMQSSDMEIAAAKDAIARSGVAKEDIGLLLVFSQLPDYLSIPTAPRVHRELGLPKSCFSLGVEAACNSFMQQLAVAEQMIQGGRATHALLIQSTAISRAIRPQDHHSVWFGDAATAVVVGPVGEGRGVVASAHRTDGSFYEALVTGCPGRHWYDGDRPFVYNADIQAARRMLLVIADLGKEVLDDAMGQAGVTPDAVDFYATHQSTLWFREVTQDYIGLKNARTLDTFKWTGSVAACSVPLMMGMGEREGALRQGDLVAMYSGGGGLTYSGTLLRWGR